MKLLTTTTAFVVISFYSYKSFAQQNVLPTNGNVGIGTTTPSVKLDVKGHVKVDSTIHVKDSIIIDKNARVEKDLRVFGDLFLPNIDFSNPNDELNLLLTKPNGQVVKSGVGTLMYPNLCLSDINGDIPNPTWANGLNKIYNDCPVNVGVRTATPRVALDVSGTISSQRLTIGVPDPQNSLPWFHMKVNGSTNTTVFLIENLSKELFKIKNDGTIRARELFVNLENPWPDYVFEKTYTLMPINKLESFIKSNGHLPNIPNAKTIEEGGQSIGEMNRLLLEKVEELTLYLIEQDKRIKVLEEQVKTKKN